MKTKTMLVALATLLIGSLCFWACQKEDIPERTPIEKEEAITGTTPDGQPIVNDLSRIGPDDYIVVFNSRVTDVPGLTRQLVASHGGEIYFTYQHAIKGFAAKLPPQALEALQRHPLVAYIEADQLFYPVSSQQPATWGLDRIDQLGLTLDNTYQYNQTGKGVTAYIVDTGIHYTHEEFGGRAVFGFDASRDGDGSDLDGHGTHVAGTVGGTIYGVAKEITLVSVRVLGAGGSAAKNIIAGVDWVTANHKKPAVANMSVGGRASQALDDAVRGSIAAGVTYVLAGINQGDDACLYSPSRVREAITVGSTDNTDTRASFSNYGECIDLFAPGVSITSAINTSNTAIDVYSGTSMSAPHAAGVAALYLETTPEATPAQVFAAVTQATTKGIVLNSLTDNNDLLYSLTWEGNGGEDPPSNVSPVADFSFTTLELTATFTDSSSDPDGSVASWAWDFGDGKTSTTQHPANTYASGGTYTVTLTVTDNEGATGTASQEVTVSKDGEDPPNESPVANFSFTTLELTATFTDSSSDPDGSVVSWAWDFGEGSTSTAQHPANTYISGGTYTVTLTVTDNEGATGIISQDVTVAKPEVPTVDLTVTLRKAGPNSFADLIWSGATTSQVEIYRNDVLITTTNNSGSYSERLKDPGVYKYKVCETGTGVCSLEKEVNF